MLTPLLPLAEHLATVLEPPCKKGRTSVDGSEIWDPPVDMVNIPLLTGFKNVFSRLVVEIPIIYRVLAPSQMVGNGISEP